MSISFENDNNVIIFQFEQILSFWRYDNYIFEAQCGWSLASMTEHQKGYMAQLDDLYEWALPDNIHTGGSRNMLWGFLIPIINTTFIELNTATQSKKLFLSSSYPKTQPCNLLQEHSFLTGPNLQMMIPIRRLNLTGM